MKKSHSRSLATFFMSLLMMSPALASAQATGDASSQVQGLLAQIKALQEQLRIIVQGHASSIGGGWMGTSTPSGDMRTLHCMEIKRDLKKGAKGDDVSALQEMLAKDSDVFPEGSVTGVFGPATERAVKRFQEKFGVSSSSTGFVGPKTREFMRGRCGQMHGHDNDMSSSSGPQMEKHEGNEHGGLMMGSSSDPWFGALNHFFMVGDDNKGPRQQGSIVPNGESDSMGGHGGPGKGMMPVTGSSTTQAHPHDGPQNF